jgi:hypothetical protein
MIEVLSLVMCITKRLGKCHYEPTWSKAFESMVKLKQKIHSITSSIMLYEFQ